MSQETVLYPRVRETRSQRDQKNRQPLEHPKDPGKGQKIDHFRSHGDFPERILPQRGSGKVHPTPSQYSDIHFKKQRGHDPR